MYPIVPYYIGHVIVGYLFSNKSYISQSHCSKQARASRLMAATVKKDNVLLTFFFAIMIIRVASTGTQLQAPYSLVFTGTRDGPRGNYLTFSCQTSQHLNLNNAEFYRNGAREDSCLAKYATEFSNGSMRMNITPACEGYFQCGRNNVLSSPEPVYGKYIILQFID